MFVRFLLVGLTGFLVDASITHALIAIVISPYLARLPAMLLAMAVTWFLNRTLTFKARAKPTAHEAARYATVATTVAMFNYLCYSLMVWMGMQPLPAIVLATALQAVLSYLCYRKFVFVPYKC